MNLYKWDFGCQQGIANGNAGMGKGSWINNDEINLGFVSLMNQFNNLMFCVVLMKIELMV